MNVIKEILKQIGTNSAQIALFLLAAFATSFIIFEGSSEQTWESFLDGTQLVEMKQNTEFYGPFQPVNKHVTFERLFEISLLLSDNTEPNESNEPNKGMQETRKQKFNPSPTIEEQKDKINESFIKVTDFDTDYKQIVVTTNKSTIYVMIFAICLYGMLIIISILSFTVTIIIPTIRLIKLGNIEKRSKDLKKLGVNKYLKTINAKLIDSSPRGNMLYETDNIIPNKTIKLLMYKDSSTDRIYCKYVPDYFFNADMAQAWSCGLSYELYKKMKIEA